MSSPIPIPTTALTVSSQRDFRRGVVAALPVMIGFIPLALVLGAQAARKGLGVAEVPLMTGLNFAGGSEFAAIALWTSPPHVWLVVAITLLVNSRHLLMGAAMTRVIGHLPLRRALPSLFFMCDESWAMGMADAWREKTEMQAFCLRYYLGVSVGLYLTWVSFTVIGAAIGPRIGDIEAYGFDMAFPAVFLVLLRSMWKGLRVCRPWLVSLAVAAFIHLAVPGAWYIVVGAIAGLTATYVWARGA